MLVATGGHPSLAIVDDHYLPRLWATAWVAGAAGARLAANTTKMHFRHLDAFYRFCDARNGRASLDDALSLGDTIALQNMVEGFYFSLIEHPDWTTTTVQCWDVVQRFMLTFALRWAGEDSAWADLAAYLQSLRRLRAPATGRFRFVRALPDVTVTNLLDVARPSHSQNPFSRVAIQWRNWLILNLLLLCGLRRGEALLLQVTSLNSDVDPTSGTIIYWLDVTNTEDEEEDLRHTRPSIKTEASHRQIPVPGVLAELWEHYVSHHRVSDDAHNFLLTSRDGHPLSAESITKLLASMSRCLSKKALQRFEKRTGGKRQVSAHDLRHTCATVRYAMFIGAGNDRELALQRMRAFFGWSINSQMPEIYARASIQDDLLRTWNVAFDQRLSSLRRVE